MASKYSTRKQEPYAINLKTRREAKFITQKELAICLGVHVKMVSAWEESRGRPSWENAKKLRVLLGGREYDYREREEDYLY